MEKVVITGNGEKWFTVSLKDRGIGKMLEGPEGISNLNIMKHFQAVVEFTESFFPLFLLFF